MIRDPREIAVNNRICYMRAGSHAYGLAGPDSDEDFRGVFLGEPQNLIGFQTIEQVEGPGDVTVYELRKFLKLAMDANPNVIEFLFTDPPALMESSAEWDALRSIRDGFLSKKARFTYSGYAFAQLKRIQNKCEREGDGQDKHAMHLVRLLRMGLEILRGDGCLVDRSEIDASDLLNIRAGNWTPAGLASYAADVDSEMDRLYRDSPLRHHVDREQVEYTMLDLYFRAWKE